MKQTVSGGQLPILRSQDNIIKKTSIYERKKKMKKVKEFFNRSVMKVKKWIRNFKESVRRRASFAGAVATGRSGEGYVDSAIKIIIAIVIGGLLLAGLYTLFNSTIIPEITSKITEMFSYSGT